MADNKTYALATYHELERENAQLHVDVALARQIAMKWEMEAHALRRELQAIRMNRGDTEVLRNVR